MIAKADGSAIGNEGGSATVDTPEGASSKPKRKGRGKMQPFQQDIKDIVSWNWPRHSNDRPPDDAKGVLAMKCGLFVFLSEKIGSKDHPGEESMPPSSC